MSQQNNEITAKATETVYTINGGESSEYKIIAEVGKKKARQNVHVDTGWAWVVLFSSFLVHFITDGAISSFGVFYVEFLAEYGESRSVTSWIGSLQLSLLHLMGFLSGMLVRRFGCRPVIILGSVLATIGYISSRFAPSIYILFITFGVLTGVGFSLMVVPSVTATQVYFDKRRSLASGLSCAGSGLGAIAFSPLTQWLLDTRGRTEVFFVLAAITLNGIVIGALVFPLTKRIEQTALSCPKTEVEKINIENQQSIVQPRRTFFQMISKQLGLPLLRSKVFALFLVGIILKNFGVSVAILFLVDKAVFQGISKQDAAILVSILGAVDLCARLFLSWLGDIASRRVRQRVFGLAILLAGVTNVLSIFATNFWSLAIYSGLYGLFKGTWVMLAAVVATDILGVDNADRGLGLHYTAIGVGILISVPLMGSITDATGTYTWAYVIGGSSEILSGTIMILLSFSIAKYSWTINEKGPTSDVSTKQETFQMKNK